MTDTQKTVLSQFWTRVANSPEETGVFIRNPNTTPKLFAHAHGGYASFSLIAPPSHVPLSWSVCGNRVAAIMNFLTSAGVEHGDRIAILAWNSPEWLFTDLAIQSLGCITVPIYPNSGSDQVKYILDDAAARLIFVEDKDQFDKIQSESTIRKVLFKHPGGNIPAFSLDEILADFKPNKLVTRITEELNSGSSTPFLNLGYNTPATIIYTSGSTGQPKGVVLTHGNFACEAKAIQEQGLHIGKNDLYLSYLPLAHVFERVCGAHLCLWWGVPIAFCKVDELGQNLKLVQPTVLLGVPAVWRKVKDKISQELDSATGIKSKLIQWAFAQRKGSPFHWLADLLVFRKIRSGLGGRLRILLSGGAPISPEILDFFESIGQPVLQGYGLTETSGGFSVNPPHKNKVGSVGTVLKGLEVKIVDPNGDTEATSGEIWCRGTTVFTGYWNLPEETSKNITSDGWFKTGDLGRLDEEGYLYITGRKKRLLKTDGGKYVAPEKIEKALDGYPLVQYVVPVGDGKPFISALVFVNQSVAASILSKSASVVPTGDLPTCYAGHADIIKSVGVIVEAGNRKLEHWETVKKFTIVPIEATVANGLLTATLKVRTEEVLKRYSGLIEQLYIKR